MAFPFVEVYENGIQEIMVSSENKNTRKNTNYWLSRCVRSGQQHEKSKQARKEFCPRYHKHVIAWLLVEFRIHDTCVFNIFQIEKIENTREINPNFILPSAIIYTKKENVFSGTLQHGENRGERLGECSRSVQTQLEIFNFNFFEILSSILKNKGVIKLSFGKLKKKKKERK